MLIKYHVRSTHTGLWLVAPVNGWRERCHAEWTDIREAACQLSPRAAEDQTNYLWWNLTIRAKRCRVPAPYVPPQREINVPFPLSQLAIPYIVHMAQTMYVWSARQHNDPNRPSTKDEADFYNAYMGGPF